MLRVRAVTTGLASSPYLNTFYFNGATSEEANAAVLAVGNFYADAQVAIANNCTVQIESLVYLMDPATGDTTGVYDVGEIVPIVGTGTEAVLPVGQNVILQFKTGQFVGARQIRGRAFIPGLTVNQVGPETGQTTAGSRNFWLTAAANLTGPDAELVVWSRTNGVSAEVSSVAVALNLGTIRSRRN